MAAAATAFVEIVWRQWKKKCLAKKFLTDLYASVIFFFFYVLFSLHFLFIFFLSFVFVKDFFDSMIPEFLPLSLQKIIHDW